MKKLFDFVFAGDGLGADTVFYLVTVGQGRRDQRALAAVSTKVRSGRFFFRLHSQEWYDFLDRLAGSLFAHGEYNYHDPAIMLRRKVVSITWLARMLRTCPPSLLNSKRIQTPWQASVWSGVSIWRAPQARPLPCLP